YDYVFLNDQPFSEEFIKHTSAIASTKTQYGLIAPEVWNQPEWIDEEKATAGRASIYADSISYRNMCRFNAGWYYRHPLLLPYKFAWRFEPEVRFFCDISDDPFLALEQEKKIYGFTVTVYEFLATIPSLWEATKEFIELYPQHLAEDNSMDYISDDGGATYNGCHFWTNFEIVDMDFWRSQAYSDYFDFLDRKGGFYYERWGDAPVHSLAIALFAPKGSVKFFSEVGYQHTHVIRCPVGESHVKGRCSCRESENFDNQGWSCLNKWKGIQPGQSWFGSP
ncbi:glycosyltransferase family 15 protein, partial [Mrakia frigida]|uniref:glycosyltransferase family 15 protein n=1 Tax=Mrakia frigida TaxID=29902 RepID=UPI003FCC089F